MMLTYIQKSFKHFFSTISYSLKVKIVIAFGSLLCVLAVLGLLRLQEPINESLKKQTQAINFYTGWSEVAVSLYEAEENTQIDKYKEVSQQLEELKQKGQKLFQGSKDAFLSNQLKLNALLANVDELSDSIYLHAISKENLEERLAMLHKAFAKLLIDDLNISMGTDLPTYILGCILYSHLVSTNAQEISPFLISALQTIPEDYFPIQPGKLLDEAKMWENSAHTAAGFKQKLILQRDLSLTLLSLLNEQQSTLTFRQWVSIICVLLGLLIVLTVYSTRVMRTPLADLRFAAQQIARGNLGHRAVVDSSDEVAKMCSGFNAMANLLEKAVSSTSVVSNKLTETIRTINNSAKLFEQNVSEQEQTVAQIAQNTVGIIQTSKDVVEALEEALVVATVTHEFAISAQDSILTMQDVLKRTATAAQQIVYTLNLLSEKVSSLNSVINAIVNVADEANLLSINTALISQSSRHRSSGFGIIAQKISELASQTAFVTLKMEDSVKAILEALAKAGSQVHHLSHQMHTHSEAASHLVEQFVEMKRTATEQREACEHMRSAILQQQKSAEEIHDTITLLSQGAKITTRSVRNLYSQIRYLGEASSNLQIIFERFHLHT